MQQGMWLEISVSNRLGDFSFRFCRDLSYNVRGAKQQAQPRADPAESKDNARHSAVAGRSRYGNHSAQRVYMAWSSKRDGVKTLPKY
jgi:hypothetical protein